jgi:dihydroorotase
MTRVASLALCALIWAQASAAQTPPYSLLLKGGHVIDPRNGIDAVMDVAITDGRIAAVAPSIDAAQAARVADVSGLHVVPGLIDLHAHVFVGTTPNRYLSDGDVAVPADTHSFRSGQTTLVDVGGPGWRNLPQFRSQIVDRSRTRVLTFINIVGHGMRGEPWEQDLADMDPKLTAQRIAANRDIVVGVKVAHYLGSEWDPVTRAVEAGRQADVPVMVDFGRNEPPQSLDALLNTHLRPGDILTHMYAHVSGRSPIVNAQGQVEPYVLAARRRGVIFDVGHGGGSFLFRQAVPATQQGFYPDVISTDLHTGSMNAGMKDILNVMSKMLNLGMPLTEAIRANTAKAAEIIKRPELGHLGVGAEADVAVLALREGQFAFVDSGGFRMEGPRKFECEMTVKGGQVVWDLNGRSHTRWSEQPVPDVNAPPTGRRTRP